MTPAIRLGFEEAISEARLLRKAFNRLSSPQQTALKIFYGLDLNEEELQYYAMFEGHAKYDELGFPLGVEPIPYTPQEHDEAVIIFGRRSAKTSGFLAFIIAYEALFGGHTAFASEKQQIASFVVAQSLPVAQAIISDFVEPIISSSPLMEKEIVGQNIKGIQLRNRHQIVPAPPVIKNFRYYAIPVVVMDEAAFWYKDAESANPDFEVVRAVSPAQAQFPSKKMAIASTIWSKEGIIWEAKNAGSYGHLLAEDDELLPRYKNMLVMEAPTPALQNPLLTRKWFEKEFKKDSEAYKREILNQATDSVSGMFTESLMRKAVESAPPKRDYNPQHLYVGAIDPAFRGDDFTFTIGHYEKEKGFIQDVIQKWSPSEVKLNPALILDEIKIRLKEFQLDTLYSDQYQLESLQQLALDREISIIGMDFTANSKSKLFGSFLQLLRNERVHLLRNHEQFQQFLLIQRLVGHGGYVRIAAPVGKHDDFVTVTVLCCAMAIRFQSETIKEDPFRVKTPYEIILEKIGREKAEKNNPEAEYL